METTGTTVKYLVAAGMMLAMASSPVLAGPAGDCPKSACGSNSPVVEGASIEGRGVRENSRQPDPNSPKTQGPRTLQAE
jgi:hypothetical protein